MTVWLVMLAVYLLTLTATLTRVAVRDVRAARR